MSVEEFVNHRKLRSIDVERKATLADELLQHCPCCHHVTMGQFPSALAGPVQYGLGIKAYVLNLLITQMVSLNLVQ